MLASITCKLILLATVAADTPDSAGKPVLEWDFGDGQKLVVSLRQEAAPRPTTDQERDAREWPAGSRIYFPVSYDNYTFAISREEARPQVVWSIKFPVYERREWTDRFELKDAALVDGDVLVIVYRRGTDTVHAIPIKQNAWPEKATAAWSGTGGEPTMRMRARGSSIKYHYIAS